MPRWTPAPQTYFAQPPYFAQPQTGDLDYPELAMTGYSGGGDLTELGHRPPIVKPHDSSHRIPMPLHHCQLRTDPPAAKQRKTPTADPLSSSP